MGVEPLAPPEPAAAVRVLAAQAVEREQAFQRPDELAALAEILVQRLPARPRILEIGLGLGGSSWLWRALWPAAFIVGVDHQDAPCSNCLRRRAHSGCPRKRIAGCLTKSIRADSVQDAGRVVAELAALSWQDLEEDVAGFDFVHIDADHNYAFVRSDYETYGPLATRVLALHDTLAYPGVRRLLAEVRSSVRGELIEIGTEPQGYGYAVIVR